MIKALRVTVAGDTPYENVTIYDRHDDQSSLGVPDWFEDAQMVITCKDGVFVLPDYNVITIHMKKGRMRPPEGSIRVKWIMLSFDVGYGDCHIVPKDKWEGLGIPQFFRDFEQLVFIAREGLFITSDYNVRLIRYA